MDREIKVYKGHEITKEVMAKMKAIINTRFPWQKSGNRFYGDFEEIEELWEVYGSAISFITIVMGEDWFLVYETYFNEINICDWQSLDDGNVMIRQKEMVDVFRSLLAENADKRFIANMLHNTSYRLFKLAEKKGYVECLDEEEFVTLLFPINSYRIRNIAYYLISKMDEDSKMRKHFNRFIAHYVEFKAGPEFIKQQCDMIRKRVNINCVNDTSKS